VKNIGLLFALLTIGLILFSCSSGSDDNGTSGGSGETASATTTASTATTTADSSPTIWLDAFKFSCDSNWTERDGALGLAAYSGDGSCETSFPGIDGTYNMTLSIQTEFDGESPFRVTINGQTIKDGHFPLSSSLGCNCPIDDWSNVCPDRNEDIDLGTHTLKTGDTIGFWGDDEYPCGDHGSYAKWHGITLTRVN